MLKFSTSDGYGRKTWILRVLASICGVINAAYQINGEIHIPYDEEAITILRRYHFNLNSTMNYPRKFDIRYSIIFVNGKLVYYLLFGRAMNGVLLCY
jgi:ribosomal protein S10